MTHFIHSHKRFFKVLAHLTRNKADDWWMLRVSSTLEDGVTYRYIPVCESGDEDGSLDDPIDVVHRFAFDDKAFKKACPVYRRWGMPLEKFKALQAAILEHPWHDPSIRRHILEVIGIEDIPIEQRKRRS